MSTIADGAFAVERPMTLSSDSVWMPFMGGLWVVGNVALMAVGIYIHWPIPCSFLAGLINGTLLSVIAVALASERLQAGAAGLLGGFTLSGLRSDGSIVWKAMQNLHSLVDIALHAMGIEGSESLHHAIEQEALYVVWTTLLVVMASLVAEWVRSMRAGRKSTI